MLFSVILEKVKEKYYGSEPSFRKQEVSHVNMHISSKCRQLTNLQDAKFFKSKFDDINEESLSTSSDENNSFNGGNAEKSSNNVEFEGFDEAYYVDQ